MRHPVIIAVTQRLLVLGLALTVSAPAAAGSTVPTGKYVAGQGARFETLAGSQENLVSLVNGLRTGSEITLAGPVATPLPGSTPPPPPSTTTFTPPTRPMGYGNISRSLGLAERQLAAAGITNPTAAELKAALNGGTVTTAKGDVHFDGVLQLRSQGMGWGKIAHTIGVHPGAKTPVHAGAHAPRSAPSGVVTAAGGGKGASSGHHGASHKGIVTAAGASPGAAGAHGKHAQGAAAPGSAIRTAGGGGNGNGHAYGRAGK